MLIKKKKEKIKNKEKIKIISNEKVGKKISKDKLKIKLRIDSDKKLELVCKKYFNERNNLNDNIDLKENKSMSLKNSYYKINKKINKDQKIENLSLKIWSKKERNLRKKVQLESLSSEILSTSEKSEEYEPAKNTSSFRRNK